MRSHIESGSWLPPVPQVNFNKFFQLNTQIFDEICFIQDQLILIRSQQNLPNAMRILLTGHVWDLVMIKSITFGLNLNEYLRESNPQLWHISCTGGHFNKDFSIATQIQLKFLFAIIPFFDVLSLQIFAHATTAPLSWHVQKLVVIRQLKLSLQQNEIMSYGGKWWVWWSPGRQGSEHNTRGNKINMRGCHWSPIYNCHHPNLNNNRFILICLNHSLSVFKNVRQRFGPAKGSLVSLDWVELFSVVCWYAALVHEKI